MVTIREIQDQAKEVKAEQGWKKTSPEQRVLDLVSEIGELSREVLKLTNPNERGVNIEDSRVNLGSEIYDCVWNLCDLANILDIDLEAAFTEKAAKNRTRKW